MASTQTERKYNTRYSAKSKNTVATSVPVETKNKNKKKEINSKQNYKKHHSSDEEDDDDEDEASDDSYHTETDVTETEDDSSDVSDFITSEDEAEDALADKEYKKFLAELFPSKYMKEKVAKNTKKEKAKAKSCPPPVNKPPVNKKRRHIIVESEEEEADAETSEAEASEAEAEEDDEEEDMFKTINGKPSNFNISFIIDDVMRSYSGKDKEALYDEDDYTEDDEDEEEEEEEPLESDTKPKKHSKSAASAADNTDAIKDDNALKKMKDMFDALSPEEKNSSVMKGFISRFKSAEKNYLKTQEKKHKKQKKKNTKKLKSLFREKDIMNDLKYFHEKLSLEEQKTVIEQIELIHKSSCVDKPYRLSLLDADIPVQYKACAYRKISSLRYMEPGGGEYYKMKNWVDTFMQIPFAKYKNLPITLDDGVEKCHAFMENAKKTLDEAVYGLNDAKLQIMQMIGQWIVNPSAIGTAIAIKGPMGTGKTTLVKEGISKILGRDFAFIALGGATDSSFLEGHSYTYEGSTWGKIVDLLIKCKSMNPVIYFDELDKISDTPKGEEIAGILTHLTDTTQNNQFHDRYFSDIDFDLSRCLFIFSYNDESKVNRILLDRMYRIQTKGYDQAQKTTIANQYLMPKICEQVKFKTEDINISEDTMHYIITNYTDKEDGVRTLKRCLEIIHTKLNLYRLMKPDTNIFESEMSIKVEFPMQVTNEIVDKLIKKEVDNGAWKQMYN